MKDRKDSLKDLSSQTRAFIEYKLGKEDWHKQLEGGDYIVCLSDNCRSAKKNHVYKVYRGASDGGSMSIILSESLELEWNPKWLFRPACTHEKLIYKQYGRPVDINTHQTKDNASTGLSGGLDEKDELLKEAKRRYPKGIRVKSPLDLDYIGISTGEFFFSKRSSDIRAGHTEGGKFYVRYNGKWGEVIREAKEEKIGWNPHDIYILGMSGGNTTVSWHNPCLNDFGRTFETRVLPDSCGLSVGRIENEGEKASDKSENVFGFDVELFLRDSNYYKRSDDLWRNSGSIHVVSSRPSVIPFKEDKHIEINILKRNINI